MAADSASEVSGPVAMIHGRAVGLGHAVDLAPLERDERMRRDGLGDGLRKAVAVDGQRRAGRHAARLGRAHDQRAEPPHLFLEQADGVIELVAAKGVAADQFGEPVGLVDRVGRTGRISYSVTGTPREATCQAASEPANPPPMIRTICELCT